MASVANRMPVAEYRRLVKLSAHPHKNGHQAPGNKAKNKYGAIRTPYTSPNVGFRTYDSKAEARHAKVLDSLMAEGKVTAWWPQFRVQLGIDTEKGREREMVIDFRVLYPNGDVLFFDVKGPKPTKDWELKRDLARDLHGIHVTIAS